MTDQLLAAAELGRVLSSGKSLAEAFDRGIAMLDRRMSIGRAALFWGIPGGSEIEIACSYGVRSEQFRARPGTGVAGRVVESGRAIVVPVVRHDPMALSEFADPAEWSELPWCLLSIPLRRDSRVVGAVSGYFRHLNQSDLPSRLELMWVVASLLAQVFETGTEPDNGANSPQVELPQRMQRTIFEYANMIGTSTAMRQIYEQIGQVARTNATALLRGESGTGKELVAHAIHHHSARSDKPFVKVNCAALPESLFESELFGHERGAFTGAHAKKKGRFELAEGGTLFLDEIGEMSLVTQAKLLRVLQFKEFERLGGTETLHTDVRIIAATNQEMEVMVASGKFREDLYYRLNVFTMTLPALRHRRTDVPALAEYFLSKLAPKHGRRITRISNGAMDLLTQYTWPGNVRELENAIERAVVVCDGSVVKEQHLPSTLSNPPTAQGEFLNLPEAVARLECQMIGEALIAERGNVTRAARRIGTSERIVRYKINKYKIDTTRHRG